MRAAVALETTGETTRRAPPDEIGHGASAWRLKSFAGHEPSEKQLAAVPGWVIFSTVGFVATVLSLTVVWRGDVSETAAGFWPASGVPLVAMILLPARRWVWVVVGMVPPAVVAIVFFDALPVAALWWFVGNCTEPAIGAGVLRLCKSSSWLTRGRLMLVFLVAAVMAGPMIGGAIGSTGTTLVYGAPWLPTWRDWVLGDGLGILVVVPLLITYTTRGRARRTNPETIALGLVVAAATALAFADIGTNGAALLPYVILVALIWAGMRFGTSAAATAGFVVGLGANIATSQGYGPFSSSHGSVDAVTLQIFLAIALITSFVVAAMASDLADRNEVNRLLTHQATHDQLTGLPNRVLFAERLDVAMEMRGRTGGAMGVLLINLDDFTKLNDRFGSLTGDETLAIVGDRLRRTLRSGDLLARLGGDEFVVLSDPVADSFQLRLIADAVTNALVPPFDIGGSQYQLSACVGMTLVRGDDPITAPDLLHRADLAVQHAKRTAGASISLFDDALEAHTRRGVELNEELSGAMDRDEISVKYQPVVSLHTGRVSEFEALMRWTNRRFGPVTPGEFIPISEEAGTIIRLGDFVLETACRQVAAWRAARLDVQQPLVRVAVNASARQLCDLAFPERVRRILEESLLPASALTLEITETALMDDLDASVKVLAELRRIGVELSLDDFGTGYSSMTHLRRMPVNTLKIDCCFVAGLGNVAEDTAIVESIINLGHSFGVKVVAEGIETTWQLEHLVRLGCDDGQGFLWSEAVDATSAGEMLEDTFYLPDPQPDSKPTGVALVT
jgi:diguanylate cyclase (GGDEF)-like protein